MTKIDPYKILGVPREATEDEIRKRYRALISANHPDRGGDRAMAADLNVAYEILTDPERRRAFDEGRTDTPDTEEARVRGCLFEIFQGIYLGADDSADLIFLLTQELQKRIVKFEVEIRNAEHAIARLAKRRSRLKNADILAPLLDQVDNSNKTNVANAKAILEILRKALEKAREFQYERDPEAVRVYMLGPGQWQSIQQNPPT